MAGAIVLLTWSLLSNMSYNRQVLEWSHAIGLGQALCYMFAGNRQAATSTFLFSYRIYHANNLPHRLDGLEHRRRVCRVGIHTNGPQSRG